MSCYRKLWKRARGQPPVDFLSPVGIIGAATTSAGRIFTRHETDLALPIEFGKPLFSGGFVQRPLVGVWS